MMRCKGGSNKKMAARHCRAVTEPSEAVMGKSLVGLRHAMHFLALLHCRTATFGGFQQLAGQAQAHRLLAALPGRLAQPAHGQGHAAGRPEDWKSTSLN